MFGEVFLGFFFGYGLMTFAIQVGKPIWKAIQAGAFIRWIIKD